MGTESASREITATVTVLIVGERLEAYADSADAYTAMRNYLVQGIRQRQMRVSTLEIAPPKSVIQLVSCPCGATGDEQSIAEHIESRVCPEGGSI